ncbi:hypothetical protein EC973_005125 [Apophysomyces ossiformis]|uniref:ATPase inhibitor, mitochondrial n=1 Tax=Apophysomyces ossiformis TaxID=679940 RepID=A0A8H7BPF6_9FUNG|nr:hypothetical protein EC973_005125 [Apophysomyces ossiformis]
MVSNALRISVRRIPFVRRIHVSSSMRSQVPGASEGATAASKGAFGDKEKAIENQWARLHDAEKLKALREQLNKHEEMTTHLKGRLQELEQTIGKQ